MVKNRTAKPPDAAKSPQKPDSFESIEITAHDWYLFAVRFSEACEMIPSIIERLKFVAGITANLRLRALLVKLTEKMIIDPAPFSELFAADTSYPPELVLAAKNWDAECDVNTSFLVFAKYKFFEAQCEKQFTETAGLTHLP